MQTLNKSSKEETSVVSRGPVFASSGIVDLIKRSYLVIFLGLAVVAGAIASPYFF